MYGKVIGRILPDANHKPYIRSRASEDAKDDPVLNLAQNNRGNSDPLFKVNHMCARLRYAIV